MERHSLSKEQVQEILSLNESGYSTYIIAKRVGCAYTSVRYWLRMNGVYNGARVQKEMVRVSKDDEKRMIEAYKTGKYSKTDIEKMFNVSYPVIKRVFDANQQSLMPRVAKNRKHEFDENYFDKIDTRAKAYLLGFIYADGNVCQREYTASIGIASVDKEFLVFLKSEISHDGHIRETPGRVNTRSGNMQQDTVHFDINSKVFCSHLIKHGVVPRKSLILNPPTSVPDEYVNSFILGYFDGDGCICISSPKRPQYGVTIVGTKAVLEFIQYHVCKNTGMCAKTINKNKRESMDTFRIEWRGRPSCLKIKEYMYADAPFSLTRKRNKFNLIPIEL